jgi:hypothetical protein
MIQKCVFFRVLFTAALSGILLGSCAASASAKEFWVEVRSPNFTVLSNAGEKEARRIADQFEQFREVFRATLPQFRVELGKPLIIFAVKDEDSLKLLLPAFGRPKATRIPPDFILREKRVIWSQCEPIWKARSPMKSFITNTRMPS